MHRNTQLPPELELLADTDAVQLQLSLYEELRVAVQDNLSGYITQVFKGLDSAKSLQRVKQSGKLQSYSAEYHSQLKHVTPLVRIVAGAAPATGCCKGLTVADADEGSLFGAENSFMLAWKRWRASSSECAVAKILCGKSESEKCCGITFLRIKSHRWAAVAARLGGVRAKGGPATDFLCDEA